MEKIWKSRSIEIETKKRVLQTCVFDILLYGCEAWVVTKEIEKRIIMAFERKCYRKILIGWTQKVKNTDLYGRQFYAEADTQNTRTIWTYNMCQNSPSYVQNNSPSYVSK